MPPLGAWALRASLRSVGRGQGLDSLARPRLWGRRAGALRSLSPLPGGRPWVLACGKAGRPWAGGCCAVCISGVLPSKRGGFAGVLPRAVSSRA